MFVLYPLLMICFFAIRFDIILSSNERFSRRAKFDGMYLNQKSLTSSITIIFNIYITILEKWDKDIYRFSKWQKDELFCHCYMIKDLFFLCVNIDEVIVIRRKKNDQRIVWKKNAQQGIRVNYMYTYILEDWLTMIK
jgi:hypothetical protein